MTTWCAANNVELVFLPTNVSWLNWIEPEFIAVRYFALNGTDHRNHEEQDTAIGAYIRWRDQRAPRNAASPPVQDPSPGLHDQHDKALVHTACHALPFH